MTFTGSDAGTLVLIFIVVCVLLVYVIGKLQARFDDLSVAIRACNDFYDRAERLLGDPATPPLLKKMIFDISIAVSDEAAGKIAISTIMKAHLETQKGDYIKRPRREIIELLDSLRRSRGDLYDEFHEAIGTAFCAILLAHGPSFKRLEQSLCYDTSGMNRSKQLGFAEVLDRMLAAWPTKGKGGGQTAAA